MKKKMDKIYAKINEELVTFINQFKIDNQVSLDPVYTGKMMFGIFDLINSITHYHYRFVLLDFLIICFCFYFVITLSLKIIRAL